MRKLSIFILVLLFIGGNLFSQVGVNSDGTQPDPSAGLDVKFTNKGLLPPRLTHAQMNTIPSPANGLFVYCIDCSPTGNGALAMFLNNAWYIFTPTCLIPLAPGAGVHASAATQITWNWNPVPDATGYRFGTSSSYAAATDLGNVFTRTETGLVCNTAYTRYLWSYNACGNSSMATLSQTTSLNPPAAPVAGTHVPSPTQVAWNWNTVPGATGYKWNTANTYATATDMATATTKTETGLTCNTAYTRYAWAYSACGVSTPVTLTQTTSLNPPATPVAAVHVPSPIQIVWNWNTVPGAAGYKWNTANTYATATDMATATTKTETGLTCNTAYTRYAWAYSACGVSMPVTLTQTTSLNPPATPVAAVHVPSSTQVVWNWNTVSGATGYKWNTENNYATATDLAAATTKTETDLTCNTPYTRYVWAYSACGVSAAATLTQATSACASQGVPCTGIPTVVYAGKTYNTVQIGTQCWFRENLDIGTRINSTTAQSDNGVIEKYCHSDLDANCDTYGGMYQWNEMMQYSTVIGQGLCPSGWHVPSEQEWNDLAVILGSSEVGGKMKEAGYTHWIAPNTGATNSSGFTALPGGLLYPDKQFSELTEDCYIWSSKHSGGNATHKTLRYTTGGLETYSNDKTFGFSIRCLKDTCSSYSTTGVSIGASGNPVCAGTQVTFTATPVNGGTAPFYQWKVNMVNVGPNSPTYTYAPVNGDVVKCVMSSSNACVEGNPATSNSVSMVVNTNLVPAVSVTASSNPVCSGTSVTYTATPTNGGTSPGYQWKVNSVNVNGATNATYSFVPFNGYTVNCTMTSNAACVSGNPATSNTVTMTVNPLLPVSVSVAASANPVCAGTAVTYTATPANGGTAPGYQWKINNVIVNGATNAAYSFVPVTGNTISCVLTSNLSCVTGNPATSNTVIMTVNPVFPVSVSVAASANPVSSGTVVTFAATPTNGGSTPVYQWKVNGSNIGGNNALFNYVAANNDVITCILTSNLTCASNNPATSNAITMQVSAPGAACPGNATVTYGSKTYNTVQVGTQCWFRENLNFGTRINTVAEQTNNSTFEKYCYNDMESNCDVYGGLYQWAELVQYFNGATNTSSWSPVPTGNVQGICPAGWHLPSDAEWIQLSTFLEGEAVAGGKMKETGLTHWVDPNIASNSSGFTVLGCGHREPDGQTLNQWQYTNYWSSTETSGEAAWSRALGNWSENLWPDANYVKSMGYSVRCVKN